jgi:hypothetical protein
MESGKSIWHGFGKLQGGFEVGDYQCDFLYQESAGISFLVSTSQKRSGFIPLNAGRRYYIGVVQKEELLAEVAV